MNDLKKLLAKSTPGPWSVFFDNYDEGTLFIGPLDQDVADSYVTGAIPTRPQTPMESPNASLIVALVNAAPFLLDVVDAARAFYPTTIADDQHSDEGHALWNALAALDQHLEGAA